MGDKIRRKPEAIIKSLEMYPEKKAVYVEGDRDRLFFEYIYDYDRSTQSTFFFGIDTVDIPENVNGNRGRLIDFASTVQQHGVNRIKCFIDADYYHVLNNEVFPNSIIKTDFKDLESYLYEASYFFKFINIGLSTEKINPHFIFDKISHAKEIALLRICSFENNFDLPFQKMYKNFSRYYNLDKGLDIEKYCQTLIQNCDKKITIQQLKAALEITKNKYNESPIRLLLHGKDVLEILKEISKHCGKDKINIDSVFWMSFDKKDINNYSALKQLKEFIEL